MILQGIEELANRRESVRFSREKMWIRHVHNHSPPWSKHKLFTFILHTNPELYGYQLHTGSPHVDNSAWFLCTRAVRVKTHVQGIFPFSRRANCELSDRSVARTSFSVLTKGQLRAKYTISVFTNFLKIKYSF